jgi:hypothetical protein
MLSVDQINQLLDIYRQNNIIFIGRHLGPDYLTTEEHERLRAIGIDPIEFYKVTNDVVETSFYFGLISDVIKDSPDLTYESLLRNISSSPGPLISPLDKYSIESIKKQFLGDIKSNEGQIFKDINNIISSNEKNDREAYEKVIRDEVERGVQLGKTTRQIALDLGKKTGDWSRNFDRIVEYISHTAFDEGRASLIEKKEGPDALCYKDVYEGACKHCIRLYLTGGMGSQPIIFKLSQLKANGTNIGRKTEDWKAVIGSTHPHCRCTLHAYDAMYKWNESTKTFDIIDPTYIAPNKRERKPIRFTFNGKEHTA